MPSTYSDLKIQLMATGENSGTWGSVTNVNLGTALEEAIVGSADVSFSNADVTLTLTNTNATQTARNLRLNLTGTVTTPQSLIVPAIEKVYIINNGLSQTITVKVSGQTGIAVPAGKTMYVYNNATDCVDAITHLTSLTLASALPVASGGTGSTTATFSGANITSLNASNISSGTIANARTTATDANGASTIVARDASGNFAANVITHGAGSNTAPSITTTGDPNTGIFFPAADTIAFTEGGAEAMRIDSSGNVGIGTTSPQAKLDVQAVGTSAAATTLNLFNPNSSGSSAGNDLNFQMWNNASARTTYATLKSIVEGNTGGAENGSLRFLTIGSGSLTERMRIDSSGNVQLSGNLGIGGTTPTTSGTGITFPATQSASTNANTLDDYEEGTWTPALTYSTPGTLSVGYQTVQGFYTKIGNIVNFSCFVQLTAFTKGTASGTLTISGLPFTAQNPASNETPISWSVFDTPLPTGAGEFPTPIVENNTTVIRLIYAQNNNINPSWPDPDSTSQYKLNGKYSV